MGIQFKKVLKEGNSMRDEITVRFPIIVLCDYYHVIEDFAHYLGAVTNFSPKIQSEELDVDGVIQLSQVSLLKNKFKNHFISLGNSNSYAGVLYIEKGKKTEMVIRIANKILSKEQNI
jgi:hypothetical protein